MLGYEKQGRDGLRFVGFSNSYVSEMSEEELAKLVTVDSLIGGGCAMDPAQQREAERFGATAEAPRVRPD